MAAARLERNLTQIQIAAQAGVSKSTVQRLELGATATHLSGFVRVCRVLGLAQRFDALVPETAESPVEKLKLQGRKRQRASGSQAVAKPGKWNWGESP